MKARDNGKDRALGEHWEREFCKLAASRGKTFTPHQIGRPGQSASAYCRGDGDWSKLLLPDVTVWSAPGEHHEIKHKEPTFDGMIGLERYRLDALVRFANTTGQRVFYTIHDWRRAGATSSHQSIANRLDDWYCGDIAALSRGCTKPGTSTSYINGELTENVPTWYWSVRPLWFRSLAEVWDEITEAA